MAAALTRNCCLVFFQRVTSTPYFSRWTRREQTDFYRVVSTFGVVYDPDKKQFDWNQFRSFARLERKTDGSLERYFRSFVAMCRNVCRLPQRKEGENSVLLHSTVCCVSVQLKQCDYQLADSVGDM